MKLHSFIGSHVQIECNVISLCLKLACFSLEYQKRHFSDDKVRLWYKKVFTQSVNKFQRNVKLYLQGEPLIDETKYA